MAGLWTWLQMTGTNWLLTYSIFSFPNGNTYSKIDPNNKPVVLFSELSRYASQSKGNYKQKQFNGNIAVNLQYVHEDDCMTDCPCQLFDWNVGLLLWYVWEDSLLLQDFTFGPDLVKLLKKKNSKRWQTSCHIIFKSLFSLTLKFHFGSCHWISQSMENSTRDQTDSVCHSSASCLAVGQVMSQVRSLTVEPLCRDFSHDITESVNTLSKHLHLLERFTGSRGRRKRDARF